jgi:C-terminal processing protease CtpA/Prc
VTIAKWNLPNGKNIHKEGVTPDVVVKYEVPKELMDTNIKLTEEQRKNLPDNQINKAIEELLK